MSEPNISKRSRLDAVFSQIYKHPFIAAAVVCLISMLLHTDHVMFANSLCIAVLISALGVAAAIFSRRISPDGKSLQNTIIIISAGIIAALVFIYQAHIRNFYDIVVMNGGLAVCAAVFFYLLAAGRLSVKSIILLIFAAGFIMRLSYIITMDAGMIQHDVYSTGANAGHAGYIEYLYENGHLPDFDVRMIDQFYHPPLHHIFAAIWMRIQTLLGMPYQAAYQNIQILTLFYSTCCLIISYKIFRRLGLEKAGLITATAIIAFCPTFYIMSGSINNDILSITFMLGAVLNTLYWYKSRSMKRILCIALCIGLGMITKLSVWMVAPAVGFIFIFVLINDLKNFRKYLVQYCAFIYVCAPIGLFWAVRNFILWGVPFTYVQKLSERSVQYVGNIPTIARIFDFSLYQFSDVAPQFTMYKGAYNEINPLVAFFKTSMFDEGIAVRRFPNIAGYNHVLFWSAVILGISGFCAMIYMFIKKNRKIDTAQKSLIGLLYITILGMYYYFCMDFPHVCTMNVRYGVPLIVIGALSLGYLNMELFKKKKKWAAVCAGAMCSVIGIYALSGYAVFNICALTFLR